MQKCGFCAIFAPTIDHLDFTNMRNWTVILLLTMFPSLSWGQTQTYYQYKTDEATMVFFDKNLSRYIPHMIL